MSKRVVVIPLTRGWVICPCGLRYFWAENYNDSCPKCGRHREGGVQTWP
jgi:hypothetical protein